MASTIAPPGTTHQETVDDRPAPIKSREQLENTEMDITPMIDITFLLLIFFLVASKMDESTAVDLPKAGGINIPVDESVVITVAEGRSEGTATVYKGDGIAEGHELDYSDLDALQIAIIEYVEEETGKYPNKKWVLIQGAGGVKYKHIAAVAEAAAVVEQIKNMGVGVSQEN